MFSLFRINYHNQFYKAYSDESILNQIKKLWLESLQRFTPKVISRGARKVIEESEYLPTLNRMITACQGTLKDFGLKDVHSAYMEACHATSPKAKYHWSHNAIYYAGCATDWFFLTSNSEKITFPIFKQHYLRICEEVMKGSELPSPEIQALPETIETPLSKEENLKRMGELRKILDI